MAATEDTFNPAALSRSDTLGSASNNTKSNAGTTPKTNKTTQTFPRIDFEPIYSDLKSAIGHNWDAYCDALMRFVRGELNAREFGDLCDHVLYSTDAILHLHNEFICAIAFNTGRDGPDPGVAAWVTATVDKTVSTSATKAAITSDTGEQRLKTEVMGIPARDRRRFKSTLGDGSKSAEEEALQSRQNPYEEYYAASRIKAPDVAPVAAGGLTKTNWELEIKKRYAQTLFQESLEFPEAAAIHARMVPVCYEESIQQGASMQCAELVGVGAEVHFKGVLSTILNRVRSNGPHYENGSSGEIQTAVFKKQLAAEETLVKAGKLQRDRDTDLLPCEVEAIKNRRPIGLTDLKLASRVGPNLWNGMPLMKMHINEAPNENDYDDWRADKEQAEEHKESNGHMSRGDETDVDDDDEWEAEYGSRDALDSLLNDCLTMPP